MASLPHSISGCPSTSTASSSALTPSPRRSVVCRPGALSVLLPPEHPSLEQIHDPETDQDHGHHDRDPREKAGWIVLLCRLGNVGTDPLVRGHELADYDAGQRER